MPFSQLVIIGESMSMQKRVQTLRDVLDRNNANPRQTIYALQLGEKGRYLGDGSRAGYAFMFGVGCFAFGFLLLGVFAALNFSAG